MGVGGPLGRLREYLELSRKDLAEAVGVSPQYIWMIEQKERDMGKVVGLVILDLYAREMREVGVTLEDLLRNELVSEARRAASGG